MRTTAGAFITRRGERILLGVLVLCLLVGFFSSSRAAWTIGVCLFFGGNAILYYRRYRIATLAAFPVSMLALILIGGFIAYPLSAVPWTLAALTYLASLLWIRRHNRTQTASAETAP